MSQAQKCKRLQSEGMSIRAIAQTLGIARNTVRGYVRGERVPGTYTLRTARPQPSRTEIRERVRDLLVTERDGATPIKQRLTAARIHRLLVGGGATMSERTVRSVVREIRRELRDALAHAYLPLQYRPGEDAQVDFFEGQVNDCSLGRVKVHILLVRACYSGRCFAYAAPNQTRESLLEGLMQAFAFFGGVFKNLWFDNLTPAVKRVLQGRTREMQHSFAAFAAHFGFEPQFCGPAKGNEKGGVEGEVKWTRSEILSPIPTVDGRTGLSELCVQWMTREEDRTIRGREHSIGDNWRDEIPELIPLPPVRFEVSTARTAKVSNRSWIQTGTNFYSVPVEWVGLEVGLKLEAERVVVIGPGGQTIEHARVYGQHQMVLALDHYLPLLSRKHRGLDRAVPVRHFLDEQDPCWSTLLTLLRKRAGEVQGGKDFVEALQLCKEHGTAAVTEAVRKTLRFEEVSIGLVRFHLWDHFEQVASAPASIEYPGPAVHQGGLANYSTLLRGSEVFRG